MSAGFPLCLGGNVFGWTADEETSFAVLDGFTAAGGTVIDTADSYPQWAPGCSGGESETIIGNWMTARGNRDDVVVATKVSGMNGFKGLSAKNIAVAAENSLKRLGTDRIDIYYAHHDDPSVPVEETVAAFDKLVREGKVLRAAASNLSPQRLSDSLVFAAREGLARYEVLQPHYNLLEREYETTYAPLVAEHGLEVYPYWSLARGFLTGKYREDTETDSARAGSVEQYRTERGWAVLAELDAVAAAHDVPVAAVALAWLAARPGVAAPIASARNTEQLADLLPVGELRLSEKELARWD